MLMSGYFNKLKYILMGLFVAVLLLSGNNSAFAQSGFDPEKEFFIGARVLSINGNIVNCEMDLTADISNAGVKRTIEVGDLLYTTGELVSNSNFKSLIQAETVNVIKSRDIRLQGSISGVSVTGLNIFGQPVILNEQTEIVGATSLQDGQAAGIWAEFQNGVLTAYKIEVLENAPELETSIFSRVTNIDGTRLSLVGDFTVNVTSAQVEQLLKGGLGVGSYVSVVVNQAGKSKKIKKRQVVEITEAYNAFFGKSIGGKPQAIDTTNRTITINNLVLTVSQGTTVFGADLKSIKFSDVNLNDYDFAVAEYSEVNGGNFLTILILNKTK